MKITVNQIMEHDPCEDYTENIVSGLWDGRGSLTLCEILDLDIPADDKIWAVTRFLPDRENRLLAADCAESVLHFWTEKYPYDDRPADAIQAARDFANGKINDAARDAARAAARAAEQEKRCQIKNDRTTNK